MSSEVRRSNDPPEALYVATAGAGRRLVLVHGFTQSGRSWKTIVAHLEKRYEVLTIDLAGHGGSSDVRVTSIEQGAELVGRAGGQATYIGYSLGGRTCLALALQAPELVEALVLIGATPGIADDEERRARRRTDDELAGRLDADDDRTGKFASLEEFLQFWLAGPLFAHLSAEEADLDARRTNTLVGLAASLRAMGAGTQTPRHDEIARLAMPVLLLAGGDDEKFSAIAAEMAETIGTNATYTRLAATGHAAPFEDPAQFLTVLEAFLRKSAT